MKLLILTILATVLMGNGLRFGDKVNGKLNLERLDFTRFLHRRDPFPEPENPPPATKNVVEDWFTQDLDNFDPTNVATWEQRYLTNAEHYEPGGCIFLFIAGDWTLNETRLEHSLMVEIAEELRCTMFYLEHRFYGESRPTDDLSDENLRFLTTPQALADIAHFVEFIKSEDVTPGAEDSPVIVIGSHYSGSLAVWFRQKYPHLAFGAWASSAPLLSVVDHFEFKELAGAVYRHIGGNECYNTLEAGFLQAEEMIADGRNDEVEEIFHVCSDIETEMDRQIFFSTLAFFYSFLAQYDRFVSIDTVCDIILDESHESSANAIGAILDILLEDECIDVSYERFLYEERQTDWNSTAAIGFRQWSWQSCSSFVWYQSSNSSFQPFGSSFPASFMYEVCADIFGPGFNEETVHENSQRFNSIYGGLNPAVTNTIFVHGQFDPWRSVGVQNDLNPSSPAIIILGATQGKDLDPRTEDDSPALQDAKDRITEIIRDWVAEAAADRA